MSMHTVALSGLATQQRWVFQQGTTTRWLSAPPVVSRTGEIVLPCDIGLAKSLEKWLVPWVSGGTLPLSVQLIQYDELAGKLAEKVHFVFDGNITGVTFPPVDATLNTPARLVLQLHGHVNAAAVSGAPPSAAFTNAGQLSWLSCNFKLTAAGVNTLTVSHIDRIRMPAPAVFEEIGVVAGVMAAEGFQELQRSRAPAAAKIVYLRPNLTPLLTLDCFATVTSVGSVPKLPGNSLAKVPVRLRLSMGKVTIDPTAGWM